MVACCGKSAGTDFFIIGVIDQLITHAISFFFLGVIDQLITHAIFFSSKSFSFNPELDDGFRRYVAVNR